MLSHQALMRAFMPLEIGKHSCSIETSNVASLLSFRLSTHSEFKDGMDRLQINTKTFMH